MFPKLWKNLTHIVTHIIEKLKVLPEGRSTGRPLAINPTNAVVWGVYWHASTRSTKKSVYEDFKNAIPCTYKTFVESINRASYLVLLILSYLMAWGRRDQQLVKYTDATDIPVCLAKNGTRHQTMREYAAWGHSGK